MVGTRAKISTVAGFAVRCTKVLSASPPLEHIVTAWPHHHHTYNARSNITTMNKTLTGASTATLLLALAACSNGKSPTSTDNAGKSAAAHVVTASSALKRITAQVGTAKLSGTVTAENDPNHLLGRPNQYTSKVTFTDTRIKKSDVEGTEKGDVDRGGSIEVFGSPADAAARAKYIQAVTKSMPALSEYDYVHGTVLVRVSHYLTPAQAGQYKTAASELG